MKAFDVLRSRRIVQRVSNLFTYRVIILLYHRVTELAPDPQLLCITRQHFAEQLQVLRNFGQPIGLSGLHSKIKNGSPGSVGIVVTFDDGYADNLHNAEPLLARYDVPASVFVSSAFMRSSKVFWKDILNRIFLHPGHLPETLQISINGTTHEWRLGEATQYSKEAFARDRGWNIMNRRADPTPRHDLYRQLCKLLVPLPTSQRGEVIDQLLEWSGIAWSSELLPYRGLSENEVVQLGKSPLIEIGGHTVSHPILSGLTAAEQRDEIAKGKQQLEETLGRPIANFAYPYGGRSHYTQETAVAVRDAGFTTGCANFEGTVRPGADLWQLPRFLVRDWNGEQFGSYLRDWLSMY